MKNFVVNELRCKCCGDLPENARMNCVSLVENVLDDARDKYGGPIKVNSFYRCSRNNTRCGGAKASQHLCLGNNAAADVCTGVKTQSMLEFKTQNLEIARLIIKGGKFDQVILENVGENDLLPVWVHLSWRRGGPNRGQVLKKVAGKAGYPALTIDELEKLLGGGFKKK